MSREKENGAPATAGGGKPLLGTGPTRLVVFSAPSGAGKSTLAAMILKNHKDFALSISFTTRKPRGGEKHGIEYYFVTEDEFRHMVASHQFLEYAMVFGKNWYGTSRKAVEDILDSDRHVLFDVDVQGATALKKAFGPRCVTIFILPPSFEELEKRLRNRKTDHPDAIEARLNTARQELGQANLFDYRVVNADLETAYAEIEKILAKEKCI